MTIEKQIASQAEHNLFSKFAFLPRILGYEINNIEGTRIINTEFNTSMFNQACNCYSDNEKQLVDGVIKYFNGRPFAWWFGPSSDNNIYQLLENKSFIRETKEYAMVSKPHENLRITNTELKIVQATYIEHLVDFAEVLAKYDGAAKEFYINKKIIQNNVKAQNPLFIGYYGNRPVSIGSLHFDNQLVGIFDLITVDNMRGRGFGTSMMQHMINFSAQLGVKNIALSASSGEGLSIYKKLGFEIIGEYDCFEYNP